MFEVHVISVVVHGELRVDGGDRNGGDHSHGDGNDHANGDALGEDLCHLLGQDLGVVDRRGVGDDLHEGVSFSWVTTHYKECFFCEVIAVLRPRQSTVPQSEAEPSQLHRLMQRRR